MRARQRVAETEAASPKAKSAAAPAPTTSAHALLDLQRSAGNQAVVAMLQRKADGAAAPLPRTPPPEIVRAGTEPVSGVKTMGLPEALRSGIEQLSGEDMNEVRVHFNSAEPKALSAGAYAQGTEIHVAPGQEQHLPHEAWHVAQQRQGRVKPTTQL